MEPRKRKVSVPLVLFCILIALTLVLCAAAAGVWYLGRQALTSEVVAPKLPPMQTQAQDEETEPEEKEPEAPVVLDSYTIRRNGKEYRYNEDIINLLLIGVDADNKPSEPLPPGSSIQSDVIVLAALDLRNDKMTLLSINRDTMCNMEVIDESGSRGFYPAQIALSFSFGDGLAESCELTRNAVSDIFYGLQIHGYGAFYMGGIATLNDALGGVTLTISDDYPFYNRFWQMVPGEEVTLTGEMAHAYIRSRHATEEGNVNRMQRQKQYMLAMVSKALRQVKENPATVFSIYDAVDDYILTDLTRPRITYLAAEAANMQFTSDIQTLTGDLVLSDTGFMELTLDQEALYETILNVFYEEVP